MTTPQLCVVVGSLRRESLNRRLAHAVEKLAGDRLQFAYMDIGSLPLYNDDLWVAPPAAVLAAKQLLSESDAVLFVTPEYNRSVPGVLKNAIDWCSRPSADNAWKGKPAAMIGASNGVIGTAVAQAHLRSITQILGLAVLGQPEVYLKVTEELITAEFEVTNEGTRQFLEQFLTTFERWISRLALPRSNE